MPMGVPSIACIGVIGKANQPLHMSLFPAHVANASSAATSAPPATESRDSLEYQFLLSTSLDIFHLRAPSQTASHDFGLLQALDERIAMYGWLSNTGIKYVAVVDMEGRIPANTAESRHSAYVGLKDSDIRPVWKALQRAHSRLMRNPFYVPDDTGDLTDARGSVGGGGWILGDGPTENIGAEQITSPAFIREVERIGKMWYPGIQTI